MRTTLISGCVAFCAMSAFAHAESAADRAKGPVRLTESQMDAVTAGGIYVSAEAYASTVGEGGHTDTKTTTHARIGQQIEIGFGTARAFACCGEQTHADVLFDAGGDGQMVSVVSTRISNQTPSYSFAYGRVVVISWNLPALFSLNRPVVPINPLLSPTPQALQGGSVAPNL